MKDQNSKSPRRPAAPDHERRHVRGIEHDHKGTAKLQWYDEAADHERRLLELEDKTHVRPGSARKLDTGGLSLRNDDSFDPYTRVPDGDRKRSPAGRTDLRRLSAWIKMMRELEQARQRNDEENEKKDK
jgi:hypothetical protein